MSLTDIEREVLEQLSRGLGGMEELSMIENDNKVMTNSLCWILAIGAVCIFALQWIPWLWN